MKHTELPWHTGITYPDGIHAEDSTLICDCDVISENSETNKANAAFIVKCVNNHYQMLEALNNVNSFFSTNKRVYEKMPLFKQIKKALAQAELQP